MPDKREDEPFHDAAATNAIVDRAAPHETARAAISEDPTTSHRAMLDTMVRPREPRQKSPVPRKVGTSWIVYAHKRDLVAYLQEFGLDHMGTVDEQRKRLSYFVKTGRQDQEVHDRLLELQRRHLPALSVADVDDNEPCAVTPDTRNEHRAEAPRYREFGGPPTPACVVEDRTFDRVRTWAISFDGNADPIDFIDRIEELANFQRVPLDQVPFTLSESLRGAALAWWRNRRTEWSNWANFKQAFLKFFLDVNFWEDLEDNIRRRQQGASEPFKIYVLELETLMRHTTLTPTQKLDRIYTNSRPTTRMFVKRREFTCLEELTDLVTHVENMQHATERSTVQPPRATQPRTNPRPDQRGTLPRPEGRPGPPNPAQDTARVTNPQDACRRCSRPGHRAHECREPSVLFCWTCGRIGVRTLNCCGRNTSDTMLRGTASPPGIAVTSIRCDGRSIRATIQVGPKTWDGVIDTGSWNSYIDTEVVPQLPRCLRRRKRSTRRTVLMANGHQEHVTECLRTEFRISGQECEVSFLILPNALDPFILGMDILMRTQTKITLGNCTLSLQGPPTHEDRTQANPTTAMTTRDGPTRPKSESETTSETGQRRAQSPEGIPAEVGRFLESELAKFDQVEGLCTAGAHKIHMKDEIPIKQRYQPRNPAMQTIICEKVDELLGKGYVEPSSSPYSAPVVQVRKRNGRWRLCIDYRQLNARSTPDAYPLPRIQHILDHLRNATYISSLDLKDGYWQIPLDPASRQYTAFTVPGRGLFQWRVMPFGLHSAPATFQRALDVVIGHDLDTKVFVYLDDIIVASESLEEHVQTLHEVFNRLRRANLRINPEKCEFLKRETRYLGHIVSERGIHTDPEKVSAIQALKPPTNVRELRRCLGMASWYRRFVPEFAAVARPMTELLKKGKHFKWTERQQTAFEELKRRLTEAPVLTCPDFTRTFRLQTDASDFGLGAVLTQDFDGSERVIAYASRHLNGPEKNYSATEKECLAIIWGIRKMREYLEGYRFVVVTDHLALKWLNSIESPSGRIARWALELQQYNFEVQYRRGKLNVIADALSRQPQTQLGRVDDQQTPTSSAWPASKMAEVLARPQHFPEYAVENGQLYRYFSTSSMDEDVGPWKLCVAREDRGRVLTEAHNNPTAGHQGIRKTIARVANRYYWPGMFREVSRYVRGCQQCQRYKASQQAPPGKMLTHLADEPWATVCVDFVGPLPRSTHGNTVLLVLQDKFTKWVELAALRSATAEGALKVLRTQLLARFGAPKVLISDNGTQFTSRVFKKTLEGLGIRHQLTAPYTPQENAVERANRVIKTMLAQYCDQNQRRWDELLPELMLAMNTGVSEVTGHSPAFLVQGREPRIPKNLFDEVTPGSGQVPELGMQRAERLRDIFRLVRHQLQQASQNQARQYNLRRRDWRPKAGQSVWVREHPLSKAAEGFNAKLAPKYEGPYRVESFLSPVIVTLSSSNSTKARTAHIRDLKEFHTDIRVQDSSQSSQLEFKKALGGRTYLVRVAKTGRTRVKDVTKPNQGDM